MLNRNILGKKIITLLCKYGLRRSILSIVPITKPVIISSLIITIYSPDVIMSKLDRRRKGVYGPAMGKKCIIFIDDLNLPQSDESGTIPPVELLRQWVDHGYWYDKKDRTKVCSFIYLFYIMLDTY